MLWCGSFFKRISTHVARTYIVRTHVSSRLVSGGSTAVTDDTVGWLARDSGGDIYAVSILYKIWGGFEYT